MDRPTTVATGVALFPARTPTLPPATHTNSYALGERSVVLVEPATPYDEERVAWLAWARGLASQGRVIEAIFVTHHHVDHVGGAAFLARELDVPLWAHDETASRMDAPVARRLVEGDALVLDGPTPQRWDVMHTPGHAPGHLCLLERELGVVVVGDMVASTGTILVAPGEGDMRVYLDQLRRMATWGARVALPAHGAPIEEPHRTFERYVAHRLMREGFVFDAVRAAGEHGATLDELLPVAYADTPREVWPFARMSLEAHVDKLVQDGRVARRGVRFVAEPGRSTRVATKEVAS